MMGEKHLDVIRQGPLGIRVKSVWRDLHRCTGRAPLVDSLVRGLVDQNSAIWAEVPHSPSRGYEDLVTSRRARSRIAFASMRADLASDSIAARVPASSSGVGGTAAR